MWYVHISSLKHTYIKVSRREGSRIRDGCTQPFLSRNGTKTRIKALYHTMHANNDDDDSLEVALCASRFAEMLIAQGCEHHFYKPYCGEKLICKIPTN